MHKLRLTNAFSRERAKKIIDHAPEGWTVTVEAPRRTLDQNDMLWSLLTDISVAKPMGRRHTPDDWKAIAMNACGWECQFVEGLDGRPFPLGFRSSKMTKPQMSNLIEWLLAFGSEHGVRWTHEQGEAA